jgi:TatD DNase family protein
LQLDDRGPADLLERAVEVDWIVAPGVDVESSKAAEELAHEFGDRVKWSAGLHPHEASAWPSVSDSISAMAQRADAVGECGLDFYRNLSPREDQKQAFDDQLAIAAELSKPIIVHCRDAFADTYDAISRIYQGPNVVLHCWTGGPRWTKRFLDLDVTFSFAGPVAFETGDTVRRGAAEVPPERAMVETDTPYLSPPPFRQEQNEPARVALVGAALAEVWTLPVEDVAQLTSARATQVFG